MARKRGIGLGKDFGSRTIPNPIVPGRRSVNVQDVTGQFGPVEPFHAEDLPYLETTYELGGPFDRDEPGRRFPKRIDVAGRIARRSDPFAAKAVERARRLMLLQDDATGMQFATPPADAGQFQWGADIGPWSSQFPVAAGGGIGAGFRSGFKLAPWNVVPAEKPRPKPRRKT